MRSLTLVPNLVINPGDQTFPVAKGSHDMVVNIDLAPQTAVSRSKSTNHCDLISVVLGVEGVIDTEPKVKKL